MTSFHRQSKAKSFDSEVVSNEEGPNLSEDKSLSQLIKRDSGKGEGKSGSRPSLHAQKAISDG